MTAGAGAVIPTSSVPLGDQVALDLSVGATGHLGIGCGAHPAKFGVSVDYQSLGGGLRLFSLLGQFGVELPLSDREPAPRVALLGMAGFLVHERGGDYVAIGYPGRGIRDPGTGFAAGAGVRLGVPSRLGGLLFVDISIRASFLATQWDLAGINERETLVTVPVTVGLEFPL
ncbi:hypothetical protein [Candidatus Palauibacter sp.]|uniref:hypothetical protein n=1 Tax=Candidatus Palauibacter sp. TaxID=3101350 RepID=UPI003AF2AD32